MIVLSVMANRQNSTKFNEILEGKSKGNYSDSLGGVNRLEDRYEI